jgi:RNA polymerase sigma factor (sigma-70 family)
VTGGEDGDRPAWESAYWDFYETRMGRTTRVAYAIVGDLAIAEEIAQQAMLALWQAWPEVVNPDGWVRRSVVNGARDELRRRRGWAAVRDLLQRRESARRREAARTRLVDDSEEAVATKEAWEAVSRVLEKLSPKQRAVLVACGMYGYPQAEGGVPGWV